MRKFYQLCLAVYLGILLNSMSLFSKISLASTPELDDRPLSQNTFDMPPFVWALAIVGGCIAITLGYVSWKKYKAEQKSKLEKDGSVD